MLFNIKYDRIAIMKIINKGIDIIFVLCVFAFMLFGLGKAYFAPIETNEYENRTAARMPVPDVGSFLDGSFQSGVESALSDQSPAAIPMKELYNTLSNKLQLWGVDLLRDIGGEGQFIGFKGLIYTDGYMLQPVVPLADVKESLDSCLDGVISAVEGVDVPVYAYYVGRDMDTDFFTGAQSGVYEYISHRLGESGLFRDVARFHVNSIEEYKENFYMTDHHYNHVGAHSAYTEVLGMLLPDAIPLEAGEAVALEYGFNGSRSRTAGSLGVVSERIYAYDYKLPDVSITVNHGEPTDFYGNRKRYIAGTSAADSVEYAHIYGYDSGRVLFENEALNSGENLLILGDSYDNAYLWQLSAHFDTVHAVDLRNYESGMGEAFSLSRYVAENGITRVIFAGRNEFYYDTLSALEG